jgi:hypothetical protein
MEGGRGRPSPIRNPPLRSDNPCPLYHFSIAQQKFRIDFAEAAINWFGKELRVTLLPSLISFLNTYPF